MDTGGAEMWATGQTGLELEIPSLLGRAGLGWAGLGQRDSSNREQREECHEQLQPDPAPPRPAPQSAALTHFQQETSHGCSLNTAGDVTTQGRDQEMEECKVRGGADMLHNAEPGHSQGC